MYYHPLDCFFLF